MIHHPPTTTYFNYAPLAGPTQRGHSPVPGRGDVSGRYGIRCGPALMIVTDPRLGSPGWSQVTTEEM
jgi:hypothetical protein